jgi:hypothetical protein
LGFHWNTKQVCLKKTKQNKKAWKYLKGQTPLLRKPISMINDYTMGRWQPQSTR